MFNSLLSDRLTRFSESIGYPDARWEARSTQCVSKIYTPAKAIEISQKMNEVLKRSLFNTVISSSGLGNRVIAYTPSAVDGPLSQYEEMQTRIESAKGKKQERRAQLQAKTDRLQDLLDEGEKESELKAALPFLEDGYQYIVEFNQSKRTTLFTIEMISLSDSTESTSHTLTEEEIDAALSLIADPTPNVID